MKIAITGAAGSIGRLAIDALDDHDLVAITHRDHDDLESTVLDIEDRAAVVDALHGVDVLLHLAANPSPQAEWSAVLETNIDGTYNAYEGAIANDVDRVVFASSNHAIAAHNADDPTSTETMTDGPVHPVAPDDPTYPDSYYGVSKVAGEALGDYYAHRHGLEVINLRIGWLMTEDELRDVQTEREAKARFARSIWLSHRDCRDALRCAATNPIPHSPLVANVISRNDERSLSLAETAHAIGYHPRDNAAETLDHARDQQADAR